MKQLTLRQQRFVEEYPKDLNGMAAAVRAGYSAKTASPAAARLLNHVPAVRAAILEKLAARKQRCEIKADEVLLELWRIARADIGEAFDKEGRLKPLHEMPEDVRRAIAGVEVEEMFDGSGESRAHVGNLRKVKFWDKPRTLELLAKHLGLLVERVEVKGTIDVRQVHDSLLGKLNARLNALAVTPTTTLPVAQA